MITGIFIPILASSDVVTDTERCDTFSGHSPGRQKRSYRLVLQSIVISYDSISRPRTEIKVKEKPGKTIILHACGIPNPRSVLPKCSI